MYMKLKDGKSKVLTLSYDDGVIQDRRLIEIMDKHGIKGTFNINGNLFRPEGEYDGPFYERLTVSEAKELYIGSPHEVAAHGFNHTYINLNPENEILYELSEDRKVLENVFGTVVRGMAYPYGVFDDRVINCARNCGICYSRTVNSSRSFGFPEDWLRWNPTCHHADESLIELAEKFAEEKQRYPMRNHMFYLWGHSYEFDRNDNWNVIEEFCSFMGDRDDIWYATNIEIYDYVQAYNRLQISYDCKIVHNPTATDVWVMHDNKTYCIGAGKTVNLN